MANILLFGSGKSASYLIKYFLQPAFSKAYTLHVCDPNANDLRLYHPEKNLVCHALGIENKSEISALVEQADMVISLLPAALHIQVAELCLYHQKHFANASYKDKPMQNLHEEAKRKKLCFLNEAGLDPGIDHMSALRIINDLKADGAQITSFESFTGGLIAPESDNNPWNYKLSWNPRNVVLAGSGSSARYLDHGKLKLISYPQLFQRTRSFSLPDYGHFEGYANRDSLNYKELYGLKGIKTLLRGTLRKPGFCSAWNILVQLGLTDDSYQIDLGTSCSGSDLLRCFLPYSDGKSIKEQIRYNLDIPCSKQDIERLDYLGLFSTRNKIPLTQGSPAQILQAILEDKWKLMPEDRDMIVMIHRIGYKQKGRNHFLESSLVLEGEDSRYTAMAKTVGLPLALCAEAILNGEYKEYGVSMPNKPSLYEPVLDGLHDMGIVFKEKVL